MAGEYVAPRDRHERIIANVVARTLGLDAVGVTDDFFELGGDSVTGAGVLDRINGLFEVELSFEDAVDAFSVELLARLVREMSREATPRRAIGGATA